MPLPLRTRRDPANPGHRAERGRAEALPLLTPGIALGLLPVAAYWSTRQVAGTQAGIAAGFACSLVVFALTRRRGAIGWLALLGMVVVGGGALAGLILDSDKAYLANDPVGDFITVVVCLGSALVGRPIVGVVVREVSPAAAAALPEGDAVFVRLTLIWALANACTGAVRVVLLQDLSPESYVLASRAVTWPLNAALLALAYRLIRRAARAPAVDVAAGG